MIWVKQGEVQLGADITGGGNSLFKMSREFESYQRLFDFGNHNK